MKWFWKKDRDPSPELEAIQLLKEQNNVLMDQCRELADQVTKLSRLQYKTGKDIQGKVDGIDRSISSYIQKQEQSDGDKESRIVRAEMKLEELAYSLIGWLDDLDLILSGLKDNGQDEWKKILNQWSNQIREQLEGLGIMELQVIGNSFDPAIAESLGTVSKKDMKNQGITFKKMSPIKWLKF